MYIDSIVSLKIKNANALFTILVVWLHISSNYTFDNIWITNLAVVSVPSFWAISSFLLFKSHNNKDWKMSYIKNVKSRIRSILVPFLIFNVLGGALNYVCAVFMRTGSNFGNFSFASIIEFFWESKGNGPLWYMLSLFCFVLIYPPLYRILKIKKMIIVLFLIAFVLGRKMSYYSYSYWIVDILIGGTAAIYYNNIKSFFETLQKRKKQILAMISIGCLLLGIAGFIDIYLFRTMIPILFINIYSVTNCFPNKYLEYIAPYSLLIYCMHIPVSRIAIRVPSFLNCTNQLLSLFISTIVTIIIICMIGHILRKYPKIWCILVGGR